MVSAGLAVSSINRAAPIFSVISRHSTSVRWSHHIMDGRRTLPARSSSTRPCIWPVSAMPLISLQRGLAARQAFRDRAANSGPPIIRILFSPTRMRRCKRRMRGRRRTHHAAVAIQQHGARAASPDINPQKLHRRPTLEIQKQSQRGVRSTAPGSLQHSDRPPPSCRSCSGVSLRPLRSDLCALCVESFSNTCSRLTQTQPIT